MAEAKLIFCKQCGRGIGFWAAPDESPCPCKKKITLSQAKRIAIQTMEDAEKGRLAINKNEFCVSSMDIIGFFKKWYPAQDYSDIKSVLRFIEDFCSEESIEIKEEIEHIKKEIEE